jgi:serine/threonine protein phosphatase 1
MVKYLKSNSKNVFYVGDIHGHYSELMRLLDLHQFNDSTDLLVCSGDLIDRGPESYQCLQLTDKPWFHAVIANHELMAIHSKQHNYDGPTHAQWLSNGGLWFEKLDTQQREHVDSLLAKLVTQSRPFIEIDLDDATSRVGIVHAGIPKGFSWDDVRSSELSNDDLHKFIHTRIFNLDNVNFVFETSPKDLDMLIVGHNVINTNMPQCFGKMVFADTGAGKHGNLTVHRHNDLIELINLNDSAFALKP